MPFYSFIFIRFREAKTETSLREISKIANFIISKFYINSVNGIKTLHMLAYFLNIKKCVVDFFSEKSLV